MTNENKGAKVVDSTVDELVWGGENFAGLRIRFADAEPARIEPAELDRMAHGLAYTFACSVIKGLVISVEIADMRDCVCYLQQRGLLYRHPTQPHLVSLRDESEAIR